MAEYYVNKFGNDTNSGISHDEAFATILHAVDIAASGDDIYVGSGVYEENISIGANFNKTLHIRADGYVVMDGANIGGSAFSAEHHSKFNLYVYDFIIRNYTYSFNFGHKGKPMLRGCHLINSDFFITGYGVGIYTISENTLWQNSQLYFKEYLQSNFYIKDSTFVEHPTPIYTDGIRPSDPNGELYITGCHIEGDLKLDGYLYNYYLVLGSLDYNNIRGVISYGPDDFEDLAAFQSVYPDLVAHSIDEEPDFNDNYTLRWSSPNIGRGESGNNIGGREAATYYKSTDDLFHGADLVNVYRDENGDFKLDPVSTQGTITSAVLDFGNDITINKVRWDSVETYPANVIDSNTDDSKPNKRNFEYRFKTNAEGPFEQGDPTPDWSLAERDSNLNLTCRYFQIRLTLRNDGTEQ